MSIETCDKRYNSNNKLPSDLICCKSSKIKYLVSYSYFLYFMPYDEIKSFLMFSIKKNPYVSHEWQRNINKGAQMYMVRRRIARLSTFPDKGIIE